MYAPPFNAVVDQAAARAMVAAYRSAWLVTVAENGVPAATLLPVIWQGDLVITHMAKANPQWRHMADDTPALLIAAGPQAYISPSWYAAKAEHGKVVPTWNYSTVHLSGTVRVHHDSGWLRQAVTDLTDTHETGREHPWHVSDAPEAYINGQLRGIVGITFTVTGVEAKAKLSQNRSAADQIGVIAGLGSEQLPPPHAAEATAVAAAMQHGQSPTSEPTASP